MRFKLIKNQVINQLRQSAQPGFEGISPAKLTRALLGLVGSHDPEIKWRAVEALGRNVAGRADKDTETGREVLRRITWAMNDESGTAGFGMPEAMGAILAGHFVLRTEFLNLLVCYLNPEYLALLHPGLQDGVLWGVGRVAMIDPGALRERCVYELLLPWLKSPRGQARGLACWALGYLGDERAHEPLAALKNDERTLLIFNSQNIRQTNVSELAHNSMDILDITAS